MQLAPEFVSFNLASKADMLLSSGELFSGGMRKSMKPSMNEGIFRSSGRRKRIDSALSLVPTT